jgi:hypothetical protein
MLRGTVNVDFGTMRLTRPETFCRSGFRQDAPDGGLKGEPLKAG